MADEMGILMGKKAIIIAAAAVAVFVAAAVFLLIHSEDSRQGIFYKTVGMEHEMPAFMPSVETVFSYAFSMTSDSEIDIGFVSNINGHKMTRNAGSKITPLKMDASGELYVKFYPLTGGGWTAAAMVFGVRIILNGKEPDYVWALTAPFSFGMKRNGSIDGFRFQPGMLELAATFLKQLVYNLQLTLPDNRSIKWTVHENDGNGKYTAEYSLNKEDKTASTAEVVKEIKNYHPQPAENGRISGLLSGSKIIVRKYGSKMTVDLKKGWVSEVSSMSALSYEKGAKEWSKSESRVSMKQIDRIPCSGFPMTVEELETALSSNRIAVEGQKRNNPVPDQTVLKMSVEDALEKYFGLGAGDSERSDNFMLAYLRFHPDGSAELIRIMDLDRKQERLDSKKQLALWRLIAEAGTPGAQRAIIDAAMNPSYARETHIRGIVYSTQIENPEQSVADALWRLHREPLINGDKEIAGQTKKMSLLAVGALGFRDKLNDELKADIGRQLAENLAGSNSSEEKTLTLSAIGNTGNSGLIEYVAPYLSNSDENLRSSAYDALRRMDDPKAQELLINSYKSESSPEVKVAAIKALQEMPPAESSVEWARSAVRSEQDLRVQALIVNYLGSTMQKYPRNETALRELLKSNPPTAVKETIFKHIIPK